MIKQKLGDIVLLKNSMVVFIIAISNNSNCYYGPGVINFIDSKKKSAKDLIKMEFTKTIFEFNHDDIVLTIVKSGNQDMRSILSDYDGSQIILASNIKCEYDIIDKSPKDVQIFNKELYQSFSKVLIDMSYDEYIKYARTDNEALRRCIQFVMDHGGSSKVARNHFNVSEKAVLSWMTRAKAKLSKAIK